MKKNVLAFVSLFVGIFVSLFVGTYILHWNLPPEAQRADFRQENFRRAPSTYVRYLKGETIAVVRSAGMKLQEFMFKCFLEDAKLNAWRNTAIDKNQWSGFRAMSWNVHFFQQGYSTVNTGNVFSEIVAAIQYMDADIVGLQEVPASQLEPLRRTFKALGFGSYVFGKAAPVHTLAETQQVYPGERLHVVLLSQLPMRVSKVVALGSGGEAACGIFDTGYGFIRACTVHLAVRCAPEIRKSEVSHLLAHITSSRGRVLATLIMGDFNQPNQDDYPADEWAALAKDLLAAKLPTTDGTRKLLTDAGFMSSIEWADSGPWPVSTAWNNAVVDYIYVRSGRTKLGYVDVVSSAAHTYQISLSDHLPVLLDIEFRS